MLLRELLTSGYSEAPDPYEKMCFEKEKEQCQAEIKTNKEICTQVFSIKSGNFTHK